MQDVTNLVMLVCASFAAMAFGVLAAYGILRIGFSIFGIHARPVDLRQQAKHQVARLT